MVEKPLNIAIVGCGNIAGAYAKTLQPYRGAVEINSDFVQPVPMSWAE